MNKRIKNGTVITIGSEKAATHNYSTVVGHKATVRKFERTIIASYYEVVVEGFEDWDAVWYIQAVDCIPVPIDNMKSLESLKEDVL